MAGACVMIACCACWVGVLGLFWGVRVQSAGQGKGARVAFACPPCGGDLDPLHVEATNLGAGGLADEKLQQQQQARCKPRTHT